jgi:hypothetical protein
MANEMHPTNRDWSGADEGFWVLCKFFGQGEFSTYAQTERFFTYRATDRGSYHSDHRGYRHPEPASLSHGSQ